MTRVEGSAGNAEVANLPENDELKQLDQKVNDYRSRAFEKLNACLETIKQMTFLGIAVDLLDVNVYPKNLEQKLIDNFLRCQKIWDSTIWKERPSSVSKNDLENLKIMTKKINDKVGHSIEIFGMIKQLFSLADLPSQFMKIENLAESVLASQKKITDVAISEMSNLTEEEWDKIKEVFERVGLKAFSSSFKDLAQRKITAIAA